MGKIKSHKLIYALYFLFFVLLYIESLIPFGKNISTGVLLLILLVYIKENRMIVPISFSPYLIYILVFSVYCLLSKLWAEDPSLASNKIRRLFILFGMMFVLYNSIKDRDDIVEAMLRIVMYGGYVVILFMFFRYGVTRILYMLMNSERITNEYLNANTMGMCAAYSIVLNVYFLIYKKMKFSVRGLLLLPALVILIASESRKAFVGVILGVFALVILKNLNNRNVLKSIGKTVLLVAVLILALVLLFRLPVFSGVKARMDDLFTLLGGTGARGDAGWIRFQYNNLGISLFKQHPILGIGIGNANRYTLSYYGKNHYLHNNYVELLACGGIIGFLLFYSIYIYLIAVFLKYRKHRDAEYDICVVLLFILLLLDYGLVSYYSQIRYFYLMLLWIESRKLKERYHLERRNRDNRPV